MFAVGVQSKLIAEAVEAVDPGPLEAMRATGARPWKVFLYGAWPQVLPLYLSFALYFWDHNTRQATILGFVGAGGLGQQLIWDINVYEFEKATTSVLLIILLITVIDRLCCICARRSSEPRGATSSRGVGCRRPGNRVDDEHVTVDEPGLPDARNSVAAAISSTSP